ncbi:YdcF family protein [Furfurilactobacillus entadae]|uniref:YdcF family protein n=1 Tax=Furfurilactobacillus entadae TaxID=2922307 RepID=UPI0035ECE466
MLTLSQATTFLIYFPGAVFLLAIVLTLVGFHREPRRLLNAWFLVLGAVILLGMPIVLLSQLSDTHTIGWRLLMGLGYLALALGLFDWLMLLNWHVSAWRRHLKTLGIIDLIVALVLAVVPFIPMLAWPTHLLTPLRFVNTALILLGGYMVITLADFLLSVWIYPRQTTLHDEHYVIVLGSGLHHGNELTKLLQARVDTAVAVASAAHDKTSTWPVLIMSGGQGADETVSEASAMADYAKESGYPADAIRLEQKSTSTFENFQYAIDEIHEQHPTIEFVTSNFHIFRAAVFAASLKLTSRGIAAPTRSNYYWRGLMREYAAMTWLHRTRHLVSLAIIIILTITIPLFFR